MVKDFISYLLSPLSQVLFILDALALVYEVLNICSRHWWLSDVRVRSLLLLHVEKLSVFSLLFELIFMLLHHRVSEIAWL